MLLLNHYIKFMSWTTIYAMSWTIIYAMSFMS